MKGTLVLLAGVAVVIGIPWIDHLRKLRTHHGISRDDFISFFADNGKAAEIAGVVFDHFRPLGVWKNFAPSPLDRLETTYQIVDEDLEENLRDILECLRYEMPSSKTLAEWDRPIGSLVDVVSWVDWVRIKQNLR